jgi:hypothetical protein
MQNTGPAPFLDSENHRVKNPDGEKAVPKEPGLKNHLLSLSLSKKKKKNQSFI